MFKIVFILLLSIFFIGCGENTDSSLPIVKLNNIAVEAIDDNAIKVGAKVNVKIEIDSSADLNQTTYFIYQLEDLSEINSTYFVEGEEILITSGIHTYDMNITLSNDMNTSDMYKLTAYLDYFSELPIDNLNSDTFITLDYNLSITENDGVSVNEISAILLNEGKLVTSVDELTQAAGGDLDEEVLVQSNLIIDSSSSERIVNLRTETVPSDDEWSYIADDGDYEVQDDDSDVVDVNIVSSGVLTFDVGYDGDNVIVNSSNIKFNGTTTIATYFAENNNTILNACVEIGDICEPISFYDMDESNNTIIKNQYVIDTLTPSESSDIDLNLLIQKEVLKKITIYTFANQSTILDTKFKIYFDGDSINSKNSLEIPVSFEPIELQENEVDNTYDAVGDGNESEGLVFLDLNSSNYKDNPQNYLNNVDTLVKDSNEYDWHNNVNLYYTVPIYVPSQTIGFITFPAKGDKKAADAYNKSIYKKYISSKEFGKTSKYFGLSIQSNGSMQIHNDVGMHYGYNTKIEIKLLKWIELLEVGVSTEIEDIFKNNPYISRTGISTKFEILGVNLYKQSKKGEFVIEKEIAYGKEKKKEKKIKLGPVKIVVSAKVEAQAGLFIRGSVSTQKTSGGYGPFAEALAEVSAHVGGKVVSGGVRGELSLVRFEVEYALVIDYSNNYKAEDNFLLDRYDYIIDTSLNLDARLSFPEGKIEAYAKSFGIKYKNKLCSFKSKSYEKKLLKKRLSRKKLSVYK